MKIIFIVFLVITYNCYAKYNFDKFLNDSSISDAAKLIYQEKIIPSDDSLTFSVIDSMLCYNKENRNFYWKVVTNILKKSDGALSEALGSKIKNIFENQPDLLLNFLYSKNKFVTNTERELWANSILSEIVIDCENDVYSCIYKMQELAIKNASKKNRKLVYKFVGLITNYLCHY